MATPSLTATGTVPQARTRATGGSSRKRLRWIRAASLAALMVLPVLASSAAYVAFATSPTIAPGVRVAGLSVGGVSWRHAATSLDDLWNHERSLPLVDPPTGRTWTVAPAEIGLTVDARRTAERPYRRLAGVRIRSTPPARRSPACSRASTSIRWFASIAVPSGWNWCGSPPMPTPPSCRPARDRGRCRPPAPGPRRTQSEDRSDARPDCLRPVGHADSLRLRPADLLDVAGSAGGGTGRGGGGRKAACPSAQSHCIRSGDRRVPRLEPRAAPSAASGYPSALAARASRWVSMRAAWSNRRRPGPKSLGEERQAEISAITRGASRSRGRGAGDADPPLPAQDLRHDGRRDPGRHRLPARLPDVEDRGVQPGGRPAHLARIGYLRGSPATRRHAAPAGGAGQAHRHQHLRTASLGLRRRRACAAITSSAPASRVRPPSRGCSRCFRTLRTPTPRAGTCGCRTSWAIYDALPGFTNGIHGLPLLSSGVRLWGNVLGRPASYGCIVLDLQAAEDIYPGRKTAWWSRSGASARRHALPSLQHCNFAETRAHERAQRQEPGQDQQRKCHRTGRRVLRPRPCRR